MEPEYILVMGGVGAGKSTFINAVSNSNLKTSEDIDSCTQDILLSNPFTISGRNITLIDTPGFDDGKRSDASILAQIAFWLGDSYRKKEHIIGVIYVHSINHVRLGGTAARNLKLFRESVGDQAADRVVIATTHWDNVVDTAKAKTRLGRLSEESDFFKGLIDGGAEVMQCWPNKRMDVVNEVLKHKGQSNLRIQTEIVFDKKIVRKTGAGHVLEDDLKRAQSEWDQSFKKDIERAKTSGMDISDLKKEYKKVKKEREKNIKVQGRDMSTDIDGKARLFGLFRI